MDNQEKKTMVLMRELPNDEAEKAFSSGETVYAYCGGFPMTIFPGEDNYFWSAMKIVEMPKEARKFDASFVSKPTPLSDGDRIGFPAGDYMMTDLSSFDCLMVKDYGRFLEIFGDLLKKQEK